MHQILIDVYVLLFPSEDDDRVANRPPPSEAQLIGLVVGFGIFLTGLVLLVRQ